MEDNFLLKRVKDVLWVLTAAAVVAGLGRMFFGLGASTYMTDALPWGMWKTLNMVAGAALATGGFVTACIIYIFRMEKYRPVARVAVLVAVLGYTASLSALLFDIGLPHRFWHPFFMWNEHSFLFEVFWCVSMYWMVAAIETLPIIFERLPWQRIGHLLHEIILPIVVLGITLSSLHHSSLGSLFMVSPTRLHPLWFTTWIPIEFLTSAMAGGLCLLIAVVLGYSKLYGKAVNISILEGLAKGAAGILIVYFAIRAADFTIHDKWTYALGPEASWESAVFWVELALQVFVPLIIFIVPVWRRSVRGLAIAGLSGALGLTMHRLDTGIVGYFRSAGTIYFPSLSEILLSIGVFAAAALAFLFVVEHFYVLESPEACAAPEAEGAHLDQARQWTLPELLEILTGPDAVRISLIVVVTIPLSILAMSDQAASPFKYKPQPVDAPEGVDVMRTILRIDGNDQDELAEFPHRLHQEEFGGEESCPQCHHLDLPDDHSTPCYRCHRDMGLDTDIFDHEYHQEYYGGKRSCKECHDLSLPKGKGNAKQCIECHGEDKEWPMKGMAEYKIEDFTHMAPGYEQAMHGRCLTCHRLYERLKKEPASEPDSLGNCFRCHPLERKETGTTAMAPLRK